MALGPLRIKLLGCALLAGVSSLLAFGLQAEEAKPSPDVERARREVKMLDDLYKTAIVLITKHYVEEASDLPAGAAFKALFAGMKEKGWHEVRLIDAAGEPIEDANRARPGFEQMAIKRLLAGDSFVEEVVQEEGKSYALTAIPVVMDKCILCHENYRGKKGAIGALGYRLPLK